MFHNLCYLLAAREDSDCCFYIYSFNSHWNIGKVLLYTPKTVHRCWKVQLQMWEINGFKPVGAPIGCQLRKKFKIKNKSWEVEKGISEFTRPLLLLVSV